MNMRYFLLTLSVLLSACNTEAEVRLVSEPAKDVGVTEIVSAKSQSETQVAVTGTDVVTEVESPKETVALQTEQEVATPLLPLGRLIGVVDSSDYKQATIDNQGKVIRLQEGDDWQGWKVEDIGRKQIVISQDGIEHSLLLLGEFRAPEASPNQLANHQMLQPLSDNTEDNAVVPQFTEEQLVELRSRLLMGRTAQ